MKGTVVNTKWKLVLCAILSLVYLRLVSLSFVNVVVLASHKVWHTNVYIQRRGTRNDVVFIILCPSPGCSYKVADISTLLPCFSFTCWSHVRRALYRDCSQISVSLSEKVRCLNCSIPSIFVDYLYFYAVQRCNVCFRLEGSTSTL